LVVESIETRCNTWETTREFSSKLWRLEYVSCSKISDQRKVDRRLDMPDGVAMSSQQLWQNATKLPGTPSTMKQKQAGWDSQALREESKGINSGLQSSANLE